MRALLHADWLRLRRRRDFWIIGIAVCVLAGLAFLGAYRSEVSDPVYPDAAEIRQEMIDFGFFEGTPDEIAAQIDLNVADQLAMYAAQRDEGEAHQRISLQRFAFPQSLFTTLGSGIAPLIALILVASLAVGDEFRFGTLRTSLLAAGDRRRFLAARLVSLLAITVGLFVAVLLLGAILGLGLGVIGADLGVGSTTVDALSAILWLGAQILVTMVLITLGTALTLLLRSGALPLLLIIIAGLIELFVAHLPVFAPNEFLSGVPQAFLSTNIRLLTAALGLDTHALALSEVGDLPSATVEIPLLGVAAIVAAWGLLFLVVADRRLRTMDVTE